MGALGAEVYSGWGFIVGVEFEWGFFVKGLDYYVCMYWHNLYILQVIVGCFYIIQTHTDMNYIKNTWKSLFKKQQPNPTVTNQPGLQQKNQQSHQQQQQIPLEILQQLFTISSTLIKQSKTPLTDSTKLQIYSLYKQATVGDCNVEKPQMFDFVGKSKWAAWDGLRGVGKREAMMEYVRVVGEADGDVRRAISEKFMGEGQGATGQEKVGGGHKTKQRAGHMKVQKVDYTDNYSHPYFKSIQKDIHIPTITHQLLLIKNNEPAVYPLHFAIDKERPHFVQQFLELLTVQEIQGMKDEEGTGILEYAELMENQEILGMVGKKLGRL